jgi:type VI secretion system secreted protein Hcp
MAVHMFLDLGDIKGETQDADHKDQIEILAFSWGLSQSGTMHQGTGGGAGKVNVQDVSLTKWIDKATPALIKRCCNGKPLPEAKLTVLKAGETALPYLIYTFKNVMITAVSTGGSGGEDRFTENVVLNFAQFQIDYQPQGADGGKEGGAIQAGWDIPANKSLK